jgi:hypothetical protein
VFYQLVPVWAGDDWTTPGEVLTRPVTLFHDLFDPSITTGPDINEATRGKLFHGVRWSEDLDGSRISVSAEYQPERAPANLLESLCALFQAAVITAQPTEKAPLTVSLRTDAGLLKMMAPFVESKGWTQRELPHGSVILSCKMVWDPSRRKFLEGSIPLGRLEQAQGGAWTILFGKDEFVVKSDPEVPDLPPEKE